MPARTRWLLASAAPVSVAPLTVSTPVTWEEVGECASTQVELRFEAAEVLTTRVEPEVFVPPLPGTPVRRAVGDERSTARTKTEALRLAGDLERKAERIEDPAEWTPEKIVERAKSIDSDKGEEGDFDD